MRGLKAAATLLILCATLPAQVNTNFNVVLWVDAESADHTIELFEDDMINTQALSEMRGNVIAASTAGYIAGRSGGASLLHAYFDSLKYHQKISDDIFNLQDGKANVEGIKELLNAIKVENFGQKVTATVEQIFPMDARVDVRIPIYVVACGHENVDAFVRRIVWHGDEPQYVGEGEGELTITINLAHAVHYGPALQERFISLLGVVAHEVFHAAFGAFKEHSPTWKSFYSYKKSYFSDLIDITHNEGIAYYLSLEQQGRGRIPPEYFEKTAEAVKVFNRNSSELLTQRVSPVRAGKLLREANLSGYWESYGAMTGMMIARQIDNSLGRAALIETIEKGPADFFQKYVKLMQQDSNLPQLSPQVLNALNSY
jgi:hypothetical protein